MLLNKNELQEKLLQNNIDFFLKKTPDEINQLCGPLFSRMVDFEQNNSHHCYTLWEHTLRTVENAVITELSLNDAICLKVAAFFHDVAKPDVAKLNSVTGENSFPMHAKLSQILAYDELISLGYDKEDISKISFLISHHDDFISYKKQLQFYPNNHPFIREINVENVAEKMLENVYDFSKMGYDELQIKYISYTLIHGQKPTFQTKEGPISIDVDINEVIKKMKNPDYLHDYIPSEKDYQLLGRLCKADVCAQSIETYQNDTLVTTREKKLKNYYAIDTQTHDSYCSLKTTLEAFGIDTKFLDYSINNEEREE